MRNFQRLSNGLDFIPLVVAINQRSDLWNVNTLRTQYPESPHHAVDDIWLRFQADMDPVLVVDEHESVRYPAWDALPQCRQTIFNLMRYVEGVRLGRVIITRLAPGKTIPAHVDGGSVVDYYQRYQCALQCFPGNQMRCGEEHIQMASGEIWWFNNSIEHEVVNNSADDRIVMIVDIAKA